MSHPKWQPDHEHIKHTFNKNRGNVAISAKNLNIGRETLHRYVNKHPELKEALEEARSFQAEDELELAISLNHMFMQDYKNNPTLASQHVRFTLEKKGSARGWGRNSEENESDAKKSFDSIVKKEFVQE